MRLILSALSLVVAASATSVLADDANAPADTVDAGVSVNFSSSDGLKAARAAGDYLVRSLDPETGRFLYTFDAATGQAVGDYNLLRHAGAIYALCQLYDATADIRYRKAATVAAGFLAKHLKPVTVEGKRFRVIVNDPKSLVEDEIDPGMRAVKTGGCSLAIIAFMNVDRINQREVWRDVVVELGAFLRHSQLETGEMLSLYDLDIDKWSAWKSEYYQGEALLAFALLQQAYPDPENHQAMMKLLVHRVIQWVISTGQGGDHRRDFDHWGLIALREVFPLITDRQLGQLLGPGKEMTRESILSLAIIYANDEWKRQIRHPQSVLDGGFTDLATTVTGVSTRLEGILAIADLAEDYPELIHQRADGLVDEWPPKIAASRAFVRRAQATAEIAADAPGDVDITGGVRRAIDPEIEGAHFIRIDFCQHAISAWLGYE